MTICVECQHHETPELAALRKPQWYDHRCAAPEAALQRAVDPVTGERCYTTSNDLGGIVHTDDPRPLCRTINTGGNCPHFQRKRWLKVIR